MIKIPGAMGSYSYIVEGLGNDESFHSCSHGAGRKMSRTQAKKQFNVQDMMEDLNNQGIELGTNSKKENVLDECKWAYKYIKEVIQNESKLIKPIKKLKTISVVKG
jgi:tRNA-splicing ligase RtcB